MKEMITRTRKQAFELWIAALESGKYKQAQESLRVNLKPNNKRPEYGFCCLGVLCDLAAKDGGERWKVADWHSGSYLGEEGELPIVIQEFMGMSDTDCNNLVTLNDTQGASFVRIAEYIRMEIMPGCTQKKVRL